MKTVPALASNWSRFVGGKGMENWRSKLTRVEHMLLLVAVLPCVQFMFVTRSLIAHMAWSLLAIEVLGFASFASSLFYLTRRHNQIDRPNGSTNVKHWPVVELLFVIFTYGLAHELVFILVTVYGYPVSPK